MVRGKENNKHIEAGELASKNQKVVDLSSWLVYGQRHRE